MIPSLFMAGIVIPSPTQNDLPELEKARLFWRNKLANPELLERTFFFNEAAYSEIRIPEGKRHWLTGKMNINFADAHKWKRESESYKVAVPIGGKRKAGMERMFREPLLSIALDELGKRPSDFPNLRTVKSEHAQKGDLDIWWGDDVADLFNAPKTLEIHRALGRAFGYREDEILRTYPNPWWKRLFKF